MVARNTEISRSFGVFTAMLRKEDVTSMRKNYEMPDGFDESHLVAKEPVMQFDAWFREASKSPNIGEANAMILSTCGRFVVIFLIFSITFNVFFRITRYLLHGIFRHIGLSTVSAALGMERVSFSNCCFFCRDCRPTARVVLLKGYDNTGFTFFTNYNMHIILSC